MNINLEYYKIFYYVAKHSNFTKAAEVLGNCQPNITRTINTLEQELHCTLFARTNRGVHLTPEGEKLYQRVSAAMNQLQLAENELADSTGLTHGCITLGASEIALNIYLLKKLKDFHTGYPGIRLKILNHSTPQAIRSVRNGEIDFAIVTTPAHVSAPLCRKNLCSFQEILVGGNSFASLNNEVSSGQGLMLRELAGLPLICSAQNTASRQFYQDFFESCGLDLEPDTEVATTDQILPLVKNELGLAFLPGSMADEALKNHEVIRISLREAIPKRDICIIYNRQHPLSAAAQKFKSTL